MLAVAEEAEEDREEVAMPEGPGVAKTDGDDSLGGKEGALPGRELQGADWDVEIEEGWLTDAGCTGTGGGLAGVQEEGKERTGVMETIVVPDAEAGTVV